MKNTPEEKILEIYNSQKEYFKAEATLDVAFRKKMLSKFLQAMKK